jgi:hypothetical protein
MRPHDPSAETSGNPTKMETSSISARGNRATERTADPAWRAPLFRRILMLAALAGMPLAASATENGNTEFPSGLDDFLCASMPPPGWYATLYYNNYSADRLDDDSGNMELASFDLRVNAYTPRLDWIKPANFLGSDRWGTLFVAPWLDLDLKLSPVPGVVIRGSKQGFGDLAIGNGLHWTFDKFEMVNAVDVGFPTGEYDASDLVNPGLNYWVIRLSHIGTWRPAPDWEVSYRIHTDINFKNDATDYTSGQTVYMDWAVGWKPTPPLSVGVAGYSLRQITDDRQHGQVVGPDGNRVGVDAVGPCIKYILPNHMILTAKYYHELDARNHPQGNQFWFAAIIPLGPPPPGH